MKTEQTVNTNELVTIPSTGWKSQNEEKVTEVRTISYNKSGELKVSTFSLIQLLAGVEHRGMSEDTSAAIALQAKLIAKLSKYGFSNPAENDKLVINVDFHEVRFLKFWTEARIAHCEAELDVENQAWAALTEFAYRAGYKEDRVEVFMRDYEDQYEVTEWQKSRKHNPTTYVGLKNLLLDIRLWLCADIID